MQCSVTLERWEWPIFRAEPSGLDYIKVHLTEPSNKVEVSAVISLENAHTFGERLISLSQSLKKTSDM